MSEVVGELVALVMPVEAPVMVKGELATRPVRVTPEKEATPLVAFWVIVPPQGR